MKYCEETSVIQWREKVKVNGARTALCHSGYCEAVEESALGWSFLAAGKQIPLYSLRESSA
jgi:hypothetical protein